MALENAVTAFKKLASEKKFKLIEAMNSTEECCLSLKTGGTDTLSCQGLR